VSFEKKPQLNRRPGSQVISIQIKRIFPRRRANPIAPTVLSQIGCWLLFVACSLFVGWGPSDIDECWSNTNIIRSAGVFCLKLQLIYPFYSGGMCGVGETAGLDPVGPAVISRESDLSKMDLETNLQPNINWVGITKNKIR
jgi:hypothetical protein